MTEGAQHLRSACKAGKGLGFLSAPCRSTRKLELKNELPVVGTANRMFDFIAKDGA
jgi:hypothetical protein